MFASHYPQSRPSTPVTGRRKVFANAMVAHVWAQQSQEEGRSNNSNFYFSGATIYSYGSHFPIATFTGVTFDGERVVLFNDEKRSVSTAQHQSYTKAALRGLSVRVFYVPNVAPRWGDTPDHNANLRHLVSSFDAYATRLCKAHVRNWQTDKEDGYGEDLSPEQVQSKRIASLEPMAQNIRDYCAAFELECPDLGTADKGAAIAKAFSRYYDPKRVAKRMASNSTTVQRHWRAMSVAHAYLEGVTNQTPNVHFVPYHIAGSKWRIKQAIENETRRRNPRPVDREQITAEQWQNGAGDHHQWHLGTLVRRKGDMLQTSRGAECPFSHAVLAFLKAQDCRSRGVTWERNGQQIRVGVFNVDRIDASGNLQAGCHTIAFDEMLRLALREIPERVRACFPLPSIVGEV